MDAKKSYPKLDMAVIEAKKSKIVSTAEAISDVVRFDWDDSVLSGSKKIIVTSSKR